MTEPAKCESAPVGKRQNAKLAGVGCTGVGQVIVGWRRWGGDGESGLQMSNSGAVIMRQVIFKEIEQGAIRTFYEHNTQHNGC